MSGSPPDWSSDASAVLLNPRLPRDEAEALRARAERLPRLRAHFWLTTSGSSAHDPGQIKFVALSKEALLASAAAVNRHLASDARDTWIQVLPGFHVGGLGIFARSHLSGARVVDLYAAQPRWDARAFHQAVSEQGVTLGALVPTQLFDLVQAGLRAPGRLRAIVIGGGALAADLYRAARELGWRPLPSYGLTECCSQVATADLSTLEAPADDPMPAFRVLSHVEAEAGTRDQRLRIRSPSLLTGYGLVSGGEARFVDPKVDGWFLTEDRAEVRDGLLRCLGRADQLVKVGGESVDFARLDRIFEESRQRLAPGLDAALLTLPDPRLGTAIHLAVAGGSPERVEQLLADFHARILPVEKVRKVHALEEIPRSALGKVLRGQLQQALAQRSD